MQVSAAEFQGPLPNPNGSKADKTAMHKMTQDCVKQVHEMREQCKVLKGCCFETEVYDYHEWILLSYKNAFKFL